MGLGGVRSRLRVFIPLKDLGCQDLVGFGLGGVRCFFRVLLCAWKDNPRKEEGFQELLLLLLLLLGLGIL